MNNDLRIQLRLRESQFYIEKFNKLGRDETKFKEWLLSQKAYGGFDKIYGEQIIVKQFGVQSRLLGHAKTIHNIEVHQSLFEPKASTTESFIKCDTCNIEMKY